MRNLQKLRISSFYMEFLELEYMYANGIAHTSDISFN